MMDRKPVGHRPAPKPLSRAMLRDADLRRISRPRAYAPAPLYHTRPTPSPAAPTVDPVACRATRRRSRTAPLPPSPIPLAQRQRAARNAFLRRAASRLT